MNNKLSAKEKLHAHDLSRSRKGNATENGMDAEVLAPYLRTRWSPPTAVQIRQTQRVFANRRRTGSEEGAPDMKEGNVLLAPVVLHAPVNMMCACGKQSHSPERKYRD